MPSLVKDEIENDELIITEGEITTDSGRNRWRTYLTVLLSLNLVAIAAGITLMALLISE